MNYDRCEDDGFIIRGKAISKLELMRCNSEWNEDFNKALDLAIKVLRQMGSEDCISRQQAVEVVHKYFVDAIDKTPHEIDEDGDDVYTDTKAVNELLKHNKYISKAIKALPPVTPTERTGEWIDRQEGTFCSECDYKTNEYHNFCPNCGTNMRSDNK